MRPFRPPACYANSYTDGMTVEVDDSDHEPDAVVHCGPRLPGDGVAVPTPLIIVEVLSPSTSSIDRAWKLQAYFRLPSVCHYLIVWADKQQVASPIPSFQTTVNTPLNALHSAMISVKRAISGDNLCSGMVGISS